MGFFSSLSRYGLIPATTIGNIITAGAEKITGKKYGRTTTKELSKTKAGKTLGLATLGTAGALATAVAGIPATIKAVTKLTPKTALGKVGALFVGGTALASASVRKAIVETPFTIVEAGKKVGKKVEELPIETKDTASKVGTAGLVVAGAGALIGGAVAIPKVIDKAKGFIPEFPKKKDATPILPVEEDLVITPTPPITPETVTMDKPITPKKPTEARSQKITQEVNLTITNKRYKNIVLVN